MVGSGWKGSIVVESDRIDVGIEYFLMMELFVGWVLIFVVKVKVICFWWIVGVFWVFVIIGEGVGIFWFLC